MGPPINWDTVTTSVIASTSQLPESFESGTLHSDYEAVNGSLDPFTVTSQAAAPQDGDYVLQFDGSTTNDDFIVCGWDPVNETTTQTGRRYSCWMSVAPGQTAADVAVGWNYDGEASSADYLRVYYDTSHGSAWRAQQVVNGSGQNHGTPLVHDPRGDWVRLEFDYGSTLQSQMDVALYSSDGTQVSSGTSNTFAATATQGGHLFQGGTEAGDTNQTWDYYREL